MELSLLEAIEIVSDRKAETYCFLIVSALDDLTLADHRARNAEGVTS